ncbi:MAG: hypothetical protein ACXVEE_42920 [Polyangiales bacterium]
MDRRFCFVAGLFVLGCSSSSGDAGDLGSSDVGVSDSSAGGEVSGFEAGDESGFVADTPPMETSGTKPTIIYANTDKELYRMDPSTKAVTKIGAFVGADGMPLPDVMTDVAVNAAEKVYGCSVGKIFELEVPMSGPVKATQKLTVSAARMYALGIVPAGVLETGEALIAGDAAGDLYWIPETGAPVNVGGFGTVAAGDPGLGAAGDVWQLSGDIAFFGNDGAPIGLATVRPCTTSGDPSTCKNGNDVVIEIDVAELGKKSASSNLKKGFIGKSGTGFGHLYGVAAFNDSVFAFERFSSSGSAPFISVSLADGKGTLIKDFPEIAAAKNGWSGAGVTTSAKVFIPK